MVFHNTLHGYQKKLPQGLMLFHMSRHSSSIQYRQTKKIYMYMKNTCSSIVADSINCQLCIVNMHTECIHDVWVSPMPLYSMHTHTHTHTTFSLSNRCIFIFILLCCCVQDAEETDKVKSLKERMLSFCSIQRDMQQLETAAKHVMTQVEKILYISGAQHTAHMTCRTTGPFDVSGAQ